MKSSHGYVAAVMTQTTDVEAELNGMLTYDRAAFKCDPDELAKLNRRLYNCVGNEMIEDIVEKNPDQRKSLTEDVDDCTCGISAMEDEQTRIYGGRYTVIENVPWQVGLIK